MTLAPVRIAAVVGALAACGPQQAPAPVVEGRPAAPAAAAEQADPLAVDRMMADVRWLCSPERQGRGSYQEGGRAAAAWLAARFAELGLRVVRQPVGSRAENVIGILEGGDEAVLISAHYDHLGLRDGAVHPGADDNASGVAVMLALARRAAGRPHARTLVFAAFGAEEVGLVGSSHYLADPVWPLARTVAVVNFDMVGRHFFEAGARQPATAGVIGLEADAGARAATLAAAEAAGLKLVPAPARLLQVFGYAYRTDDWWFRRRGMPAYHFSTGFHDDYHRPSDTPDKLVPEQLGRVANTAAGLIDYLAGGETR
jgi:Zn-dependent M28 family amino/carboxypeptidase